MKCVPGFSILSKKMKCVPAFRHSGVLGFSRCPLLSLHVTVHHVDRYLCTCAHEYRRIEYESSTKYKISIKNDTSTKRSRLSFVAN